LFCRSMCPLRGFGRHERLEERAEARSLRGRDEGEQRTRVGVGSVRSFGALGWRACRGVARCADTCFFRSRGARAGVGSVRSFGALGWRAWGVRLAARTHASSEVGGRGRAWAPFARSARSGGAHGGCGALRGHMLLPKSGLACSVGRALMGWLVGSVGKSALWAFPPDCPTSSRLLRVQPVALGRACGLGPLCSAEACVRSAASAGMRGCRSAPKLAHSAGETRVNNGRAVSTRVRRSWAPTKCPSDVRDAKKRIATRVNNIRAASTRAPRSWALPPFSPTYAKRSERVSSRALHPGQESRPRSGHILRRTKRPQLSRAVTRHQLHREQAIRSWPVRWKGP
jgi:hypothetical protein